MIFEITHVWNNLFEYWVFEYFHLKIKDEIVIQRINLVILTKIKNYYSTNFLTGINQIGVSLASVVLFFWNDITMFFRLIKDIYDR